MFKHPSKSTIDRINEYIVKEEKNKRKKVKNNNIMEKGKIYRTDEAGEIVLNMEKNQD